MGCDLRRLLWARSVRISLPSPTFPHPAAIHVFVTSYFPLPSISLQPPSFHSVFVCPSLSHTLFTFTRVTPG
jgi:hypothetical protein